MNIEELRQRRNLLEKDIESLITAFEKATGVGVGKIEHSFISHDPQFVWGLSRPKRISSVGSEHHILITLEV